MYVCKGMKSKDQALQRLSALEAQRRIDEPGTIFVEEIQPGWILYELADGTALLTMPDLVETGDPAYKPGVKMVLGVGEIWKSPASVLASLPTSNRPASKPPGASHVLEGIFNAPGLVTSRLEEQCIYLNRELGLSASPPLTLEGLSLYDESLPEDVDDYDLLLIRAVACVLSETVRAGVGGIFEIEKAQFGSGPIWEPWIKIPGRTERIVPAADYVSAIHEGDVPNLQMIYMIATSM